HPKFDASQYSTRVPDTLHPASPSVTQPPPPPNSFTPALHDSLPISFTGYSNHYEVHWDPSSPTAGGCCTGPQNTTSSSSWSPTSNPKMISVKSSHVVGAQVVFGMNE